MSRLIGGLLLVCLCGSVALGAAPEGVHYVTIDGQEYVWSDSHAAWIVSGTTSYVPGVKKFSGYDWRYYPPSGSSITLTGASSATVTPFSNGTWVSSGITVGGFKTSNGEACDAHGEATTTPPEPYQPDPPSDADDTYGVGDPPGGWQKIEVFTMRYHPGDTTYTPIAVGTIMEWNGANYVVVPDEVLPRGDSVEGHGSWLTIRWGDSYYMVVSVSASSTVSVPECDYGVYTSECSAEGFALLGEGDDPGSGDDDDDDDEPCECPVCDGCCDYIEGQLAADIGAQFRAALADLPQRIWAEFQSTVQNPLINQMGDEIYETFNNMTADGEILDEWLERRLEEAVNEMGDEIYETFNNMTAEGEILDEWLADGLTKMRTDMNYDREQFYGARMPRSEGLDQGASLYKSREWDLNKPQSMTFSRQWGLVAPSPESHSFSMDVPLPGGSSKYVVWNTELSGCGQLSEEISSVRRVVRACLLVMVSVVMVGNILRTLRQY